MIYLFTGAPGASKTLNAIKFITETFKDRNVYAYNVRGLKNGWNVLTKDEALTWHELPEGSVIFLDECQEIFPPRRNGSDVPEYVSNLNTHRHKGIDIVLVTQHPMLIDGAVRRVVNEHRHLTRSFGMNYAKQALWSECVSDPAGKSELSSAVITRVPFDKKYFSAYTSAEMHTAKRRIPKPVFVLLFFLVLAGGLIYSFFDRIDDKKKPVVATNEPQLHALNTAGEVQPKQSGESWIDQQTPRIEGMPWTAPKYDELRKPVAWPRPQCVIFRRQCRCYSQQATLMPDVPTDFCLSVVKHGYFDETKPDAMASAYDTQPTPAPEPQARHAGAAGRAVLLGSASGSRSTGLVMRSPAHVVPDMSRAKGQRFDDALYFE